MIPNLIVRFRRPAIAALAFVAACHATSGSSPVPAAPTSTATATAVASRPAPYSHALGSMDGSHLTATIVEVRYGPGESSKPHSHPCDVIGYILEGSYRTQVRGGPETVYTAGQSFYEAANGTHVVSANASADKPVRFLAYFTCDRQTPLTVPPHDSGGSGSQ